MGNVQVRLPDDMEGELEELAAQMHASRSEAMRRALAEGLQVIRFDHALHRYIDGDVSLARAAELADVSLVRMARAAAERGVPYFRYSAEEAEADVETARRWFQEHRG